MPLALDSAEQLSAYASDLEQRYAQSATGDNLDLWADAYNAPRREATFASGTVRFQGDPGTAIPAGTVVSTAAMQNAPAIEFTTNAAATINASGSVDVYAACEIPGMDGNISAGSIALLLLPISGVRGLTNPAAMTGGVDVEDDETLRPRVLQYMRRRGGAGTREDYIIWAMEVPGVGAAYVQPLWDGPGTVKVMIVDGNGQPANLALVAATQEHIAPDGRNGGGRAPIGAEVTVAAPIGIILNFTWSWTLTPDADEEAILNAVKRAFMEYYVQLGMGGTVVYSRMMAMTVTARGVIDVTNFRINDGTGNIQMGTGEYPVTGTVTVI